MLSILIWLSCIVSLQASNAVPTNQLTALQLLYNATSGSSWTYVNISQVWNFNEPNINPCVNEWEGVYCNEDCSSDVNSSCIVTSIILDENGMSGTLPNEFFVLINLNELSLSSNDNLTGTIPSTIGYMDQLTSLTLTDCNLNGSIPSSLVNLTLLENLNLESNCLSQQIPLTLYNMSQLKFLWIGENILTGTISDWINNLI